jgi:hypothetical protein
MPSTPSLCFLSIPSINLARESNEIIFYLPERQRSAEQEKKTRISILNVIFCAFTEEKKYIFAFIIQSEEHTFLKYTIG